VRRSRILPFLGPILVLYLLADTVARRGGLSLEGAFVGAIAALLSITPFALGRSSEREGFRTVGVLGIMAAIGLVGLVDGSVSVATAACSLAAWAAVAGVTLDLALSSPDRPRALDRGPWLRALIAVASFLVAAFAVVRVVFSDLAFWAAVPIESAFAAPAIAVLIAIAAAIVLRWSRRALGSTPEDLAQNAWGLLGSVVALATGGGACFLFWTQQSGDLARGLAAGTALALVIGHGAMVRPSRRASAGAGTRKLIAVMIATGGVIAAVIAGRHAIPIEPVPLGFLTAAGAIALVVVYRLADRAMYRLLAPAAGRLLDAIEIARRDAHSAASLEELARTVLGPIRRAARDPEAEAFILMLDPEREARVDKAGEPHVRKAPMPEALRARLVDRPGEIVIRSALERLTVRRPDIRPLVDLLLSMDAFAVVPLMRDSEVEGALVIPKGRRTSALSIEELHALEQLAGELAASVSLIGARSRADERANRAERTRIELSERIEVLEESLAKAHADMRVLRAGRNAARVSEPPIGYGPAMRALARQLADVAPLETPVLLVAPPGSEIEQIAHRIHSMSSRADHAFVVGDCGTTRSDEISKALFGSTETNEPGWLRLATGGTVLLLDLPALPPDVQRTLAETISTREIRPIEGTSLAPFETRIIASSQCALAELGVAGAFDAELAHWFSSTRLDLPPLADRPEDLESLVLLAIDRACRVAGKSVVGIDPSALDTLRKYAFPGNLRELEWVIERAVAHASGSKIAPEDLPLLANGTPHSTPLAGTYAELEKRILLNALERAGGNKSEAARLLGLKRTTFLDKLRRIESGEPSSELTT
jgi:two-component system response regulator HydG